MFYLPGILTTAKDGLHFVGKKKGAAIKLWGTKVQNRPGQGEQIRKFIYK